MRSEAPDDKAGTRKAVNNDVTATRCCLWKRRVDYTIGHKLAILIEKSPDFAEPKKVGNP
jgi:hypothetical protein